jgi:hypothetical protein
MAEKNDRNRKRARPQSVKIATSIYQTAGSKPFCLATCVAMASIKSGDRQS